MKNHKFSLKILLFVAVLTFLFVGNIADVKAGRIEIESNEVVAGTGPGGATDTKDEMSIVKFADKEEYNVGDIITYKIIVQCTDTKRIYHDITINDVMTEGMKLIQDTFEVTYKTGTYTVNEKYSSYKDDIIFGDNSFTITAFNEGKTYHSMYGSNAKNPGILTITYQAEVVDSKLAGKKVDNLVVLHYYKNDEENEMGVKVTVDIIGPDEPEVEQVSNTNINTKVNPQTSDNVLFDVFMLMFASITLFSVTANKNLRTKILTTTRK